MNPQIFSLLTSMPEEALFRLDSHTIVSMVIQLISIIILFVILKKVLHKPVGDFLKKREERIEGDLQYAEDEKVKASKLKIEYEQKITDIEREKNEILDAARKLAADRTKESEAVAKTEAETIKARALKEIALEEERAKSEMKQAVIDVSSLMVAKFMARTIDAATHEKLFDETMAELEEMAWHN